MSRSERRVTGLKTYAAANLFADWRVTPGLAVGVRERARLAEERRRSRAWLMPTATAVAALALFALLGRGFSGGTAAGPAAGPAGQATGAAQVPDRLSPAGSAANPPAIDLAADAAVKVTITDEAAFTVRTTDAYGNAVWYSSVQSDLDSVPAPASAIAGVEVQPGKKLILNGDYTIRVKELEPAIDALQRLALERGGYLVETTVNRADDGSAAARIVLRLPAERFGEVVGSVGELGDIQRQQVWSQDVTAQFIDQESRLKVLTEHEQKLQELAQSAANFDDWLRLAKQINETRAQVESLQGSLKQLANQVEYSTLNIALVQPAPGKEPTVVRSEGVGAEMSGAFRASVGLLGSAVRWSLVGLSAAAPFLLPLGLVGGAVWLGVRRRR